MFVYLLLDMDYAPYWTIGLIAVVFLYGPLIFFHTQSLIWKAFRLQYRDLLHLLPFGVLAFLGFVQYDPRQQFGWLLYISVAIYLTLSFRSINKYNKVVQHTQSNSDQLSLSWLKLALTTFSTIIILDLLTHILQTAPSLYPIVDGIDYLVIFLVFLFVNMMVYKGLKQPQLFGGIEEKASQVYLKDKTTLNKALIEKEHKELIEQLTSHLEHQQPFKDPGLTINELAEQLKVPPRNLSSVINQYYEQNFSDFINTYRIKLAKERLQYPKGEKETILEVLYEVGFNSKSSFNTIFKKKTGLTPSEYKKKYMNTSVQD